MAQRSRPGRDRANKASREIAAYRERIDKLDERLLALFNQRARLAQEIGKRKQVREDSRTFVPGRERRVIDRLLKANRGPLPNRAVVGIFREVIAASRALEGPLLVAYLGPEATFTEAAARIQFGATAEYLPLESIASVFTAVESGRVNVGVVPVENSTEGVVTHTLDSFIDSPVKICAELELKVRHCLMARGTSLKGVRRIVSHPQSLAQCRQWLMFHCPKIPTDAVSSNGRAAQIAAEDSSTAAIAGAMAAERYGLEILEREIQDDPNNTTRFLVLATEDSSVPSGADKTSILMTVRDEVGILQRILRPFSTHGVNLCGIESRPLRGKPWEYVFFLDLHRHRQQAAVRRALAEVSKHCVTLKILGSYPSASAEGA